MGREEPAATLDGSPADPDRPASLADLFAERYEPMVRLAHLLTGSNAVAEDVVQNAFVAMHRRWVSVERPVEYLRKTVVNGTRTWHRSRSRERARVVKWSGDEQTPFEARELLDALGGLPARQRAVLVLRYYEDLPEAEIAALLGRPVGTVKSDLHRGLARLREVVER
jgi:RNA polymerase sigma-70 factor (sigma-E family)